MIEKAHINDVTTVPLFRKLFPRDEGMIETIVVHMKQHGYDPSQPIICWLTPGSENKPVVIDGHTRLVAARRCNLSEIYIDVKDFKDEAQALEYSIHNQKDRRNMTDGALIRCIEAVDKLKRPGERTDLASSEARLAGKSSKQTAKVVGTSSTKVEKARTVINEAGSDIKQAVLNGEKSINQAYRDIRKKRRTEPPSQADGEIVDCRVSGDEAKKESIEPGLLEKLSGFLDRVLAEAVELDCLKSSIVFGASLQVRLRNAPARRYRREDDPPKEMNEMENQTWHAFFKALRAARLCNILSDYLRDFLPPEVERGK